MQRARCLAGFSSRVPSHVTLRAPKRGAALPTYFGMPPFTAQPKKTSTFVPGDFIA